MIRSTLVALLALALRLTAAIDDPVRVESGLLSGVPGASSEVRVYGGIPFAAPPLGDLRWRPPQPPAPWQGVRPAGKFSDDCMQTPYPAGSMYHTEARPMSEDCLYLNVWTAAKSAGERRPVMVWIHGGSLTRGSGATPGYNGEELARKGVVLVTINYRLGVFGFLAHPELTKESAHHSSGNYGFLDQLAALQWVHRNIAQFGGDPARVTVFGESAGSWSVNVMVASPLAKGLFQRAIGESGASFARTAKLARMEEGGVKIAQSAGADSLSALRAKPAEELVKIQGGFAVMVDGWVLPKDVHAIFAAGRQNDVPLVIGSNADEGTAFTPPSIKAESVRERAKDFGGMMDAFLKLYPAGSDDEARASAAAAIRDQVFGWEMRTWARMHTATGKSKVYLYYFSRVPPGPGSARYGAYHGAEIPYVFHNLNPGRRPWEDVDRALADTISSYWVNFATTGDPNGTGLPEWPAYREKSDLALELGDRIEARTVPHKAALDFLDAWIGNLRKASQ